MKTTDWDVGREVLCFLQCGYNTFQALDIFLATNIVDKGTCQKKTRYIKVSHQTFYNLVSV